MGRKKRDGLRSGARVMISACGYIEEAWWDTVTTLFYFVLPSAPFSSLFLFFFLCRASLPLLSLLSPSFFCSLSLFLFRFSSFSLYLVSSFSPLFLLYL